MKITLAPGEQITVTFAGSDGEITVAFNPTSITVHADLPDTNQREGYHL